MKITHERKSRDSRLPFNEPGRLDKGLVKKRKKSDKGGLTWGYGGDIYMKMDSNMSKDFSAKRI
jgi:hypothetical protein